MNKKALRLTGSIITIVIASILILLMLIVLGVWNTLDLREIMATNGVDLDRLLAESGVDIDGFFNLVKGIIVFFIIFSGILLLFAILLCANKAAKGSAIICIILLSIIALLAFQTVPAVAIILLGDVVLIACYLGVKEKVYGDYPPYNQGNNLNQGSGGQPFEQFFNGYPPAGNPPEGQPQESGQKEKAESGETRENTSDDMFE